MLMIRTVVDSSSVSDLYGSPDEDATMKTMTKRRVKRRTRVISWGFIMASARESWSRKEER
jgi:hypothetical protein